MSKASPLRLIAVVIAIATTSVEASAPRHQPAAAEETDGRLAVLGERLFFDTRLSADGKVSCATCHDPSKAFSDGKARAVGVYARIGTRNTPSILNVRDERTMFWDGRVTSLEDQAALPLTNSFEHGLDDPKAVVALVQRDLSYVQGFRDAFPNYDEVSLREIAVALSAFERKLISKDSPFDRYYYGGDKTALPASAIRGLALFEGTGGCSHCHLVSSDAAPFSDHSFHPSPLRISDKAASQLAELATRVVRMHGEEKKQLDDAIARDELISSLGRFVVTLAPQDIGKFKTPSLRNVAITFPYMHDGSVDTLEQAIEMELYARTASKVEPIVLTPNEKEDLAAFLRSLTDMPGLPNFNTHQDALRQ